MKGRSAGVVDADLEIFLAQVGNFAINPDKDCRATTRVTLLGVLRSSELRTNKHTEQCQVIRGGELIVRSRQRVCALIVLDLEYNLICTQF